MSVHAIFRILAVMAVASAPMIAAAYPAYAQTDNEIPNIFKRQIHSGITYEAYLSAVMQPFRTVAGKRTFIDKDFLDNMSATRKRLVKAQLLAFLLSADEKADGRITEDEIRRSVTERLSFPSNPNAGNKAYIEREVANLMKYDTNHDGVIDIAEMRAAEVPMPSESNPAAEYLALAPNGHLTAADLLKKAQQVFVAVDADGDGTISEAEAAAIGVPALPPSGPTIGPRMNELMPSQATPAKPR